MDTSFFDQFMWLVGVGQEYSEISLAQIVARTLVVYLMVFALIRIGKRRFMGSYSATDILLGFVVGSVMARAITGAVSILNMTVVIGVLLGLHYIISTISYYWSGFESVIESDIRKLVEDGKIDEKAMKASKITDEDLEQACHDGGVDKVDDVKAAYLERDGSITIVPKRKDRPTDDE